MDLVAIDSRWDWAALRRRSRLEALRVLRDAHAADEAAQEAMARAWRQRHQCRTPSQPDGWVAQIARNEALRLRNRERRRFATEAPQDDPEPPRTTSHEREDELLERLSVRQALARLSPEDRHLVELRYEADLAQPEIARLLEMPEGTVKVRLHRIRARLKTVIREAA
jgi:RNA polymerase sigma-70 factor, ECF subfamily